MTKVQPISFKGNFIKADKFKGQTALFVHDVINKKVDNISNREILEKLPFDVEIRRKQKSHKPIHPSVVLDIDYKQFWGKQSYYIEHGVDDAIVKMREWFMGFANFIEKNKNKQILTRKEELDNIFNFINSYGQVKRYKPIQRH